MATYHLSQVTTKNARQRRIQELWNTGAELIVSRLSRHAVTIDLLVSARQILIDHGTKEGFKAVSEARSQLLELGRTTPKDSLAEEPEPETRSARKRKARRRRLDDDDDVLEVGGQVYYAEGSEAERASRQESQAIDAVGSHVLAPVSGSSLASGQDLILGHHSALTMANALSSPPAISATFRNASRRPPSCAGPSTPGEAKKTPSTPMPLSSVVRVQHRLIVPTAGLAASAQWARTRCNGIVPSWTARADS